MISSQRLNFRAIENRDVAHYQRWINDSETNFWRGLYHPMSLVEAAEALETLKNSSQSQISLLIETKEFEQIGLVGLRGICPRSRRAEIWIYLGEKKIWNQKYGQEAIATLVNYAFEEMNLHRIWLECDPEYEQSVKCYSKVGFVLEGKLRDGYFRHGRYRDTIIMGLVNSKD